MEKEELFGLMKHAAKQGLKTDVTGIEIVKVGDD